MRAIKHIFLDLDGPLLDCKERHYFCYRAILKKFGFKPIGIEEYWEKKRALLNRRDLLSLSGASEIYEEFLASWLLLIESPDALALDKVQEGAIGCLHSWKAQGIKMTLVTMRKNKLALEAQLAFTGLRPFLDTVLVCDHADGAQGKADAVRHIYSESSFKRNAIWIGDTEADWGAAQSLGCEVVLLANGLRNEGYLKELKDSVVKSSIMSLKEFYVS
jgi:phosphoglycolate phosphatase-like HAD superfamily hydrolase